MKDISKFHANVKNILKVDFPAVELNMDQYNSEYGDFLRRDIYNYILYNII